MKSFDNQVRDWAASKPADAWYPFDDTFGCALCQFLKDAGMARRPVVTHHQWQDAVEGPSHPLSGKLGAALAAEPHTFGALAERLEGTTDNARRWAREAGEI